MKKKFTRLAALLMLAGFAVGSLTSCGSSTGNTDSPPPPPALENTDSVTVIDSGWSYDGEGEKTIWSQTFTRRMPDGRVFTCFLIYQAYWMTTSQIWCDNADKPAR